MNILIFYFSFFLLIFPINGNFWTNTSHQSLIRIPRDKPDEFVCTGGGIMTKVLKLLFPTPRTPQNDSHIKLHLIQENGKSIVIAENGQIGDIVHSNFEPLLKTVVLVHGFMGSPEIDWIERMTRAYKNYEDVNVLIVDWSVFAGSLNYPKVASYTIPVGAQIADLLEKIHAAYDETYVWGSIHLIGFSLGAHVAGIAGDKLKKNSERPWKVARITGLDPAHPCFKDSSVRLDKSDAPFVDIIHTNGNKAFGVTLGTLAPMGHVDFYVNGGQLQPGCKLSAIFKIGFWIVPASIKEAMCSHERAVEYFIESLERAASLKNHQLIGSKWNFQDFCSLLPLIYEDICTTSCKEMGIATDMSKDTGTYFVPAANKSPFYEIKKRDQLAIAAELKRALSI